MEAIKSFDQLRTQLKNSGERVRVAVVWAHDGHTPEAVRRAVSDGFATAIFVGHREETLAAVNLTAEMEHLSFVNADSPEEASAAAVALVREGKADVIMKGLVNTDVLLRAVLNKQTGILPYLDEEKTKRAVLTHIAVVDIPRLKRLLFITDAAVIPNPTVEQRAAQIRYASHLCHCFGIEQPRIAMLHCTEKTSEKFPITLDYAALKERAEAGEFGDILLDGPLDLLCSLSPEGLADKHLESKLKGKADVLMFSDIEMGNGVYKSFTLFADALIAGMLFGPQCPVVLTSRGDSIDAKFCSLCAAIAVSKR